MTAIMYLKVCLNLNMIFVYDNSFSLTNVPPNSRINEQ